MLKWTRGIYEYTIYLRDTVNPEMCFKVTFDGFTYYSFEVENDGSFVDDARLFFAHDILANNCDRLWTLKFLMRSVDVERKKARRFLVITHNICT